MGHTCAKNRLYLRQPGWGIVHDREVHLAVHLLDCNELCNNALTIEWCPGRCTTRVLMRYGSARYSVRYSWLRRQAKYSSRTLRAASEGTGAAWQPAPVRTIVCGALLTKRGHSGRPGPFGSPVLAKLVQ